MQSKIQIRCTDGVAIGYAMTENDWSCLHDVFESLLTSEKTDVVKETARYLQACHLIFEKGILSHVFIRSNESAVFKNIQQGWKYFEEWAEEHNNTGMYKSKTLFNKHTVCPLKILHVY